MYDEFLLVFEEEKKAFHPIQGSRTFRSALMRQTLQSGKFWYFHALESPVGLYNLFQQHIHPFYESTKAIAAELPRVVSAYWSPDAEEVLATKLRHKADYDAALHHRFEVAKDSQGDIS
ncbi:hypothetical protein BJX70DRAFT_401468 [Aspergillus crustosus]